MLFMMEKYMHYSIRREFTGSESAALSAIESILLSVNFRIVESSASRLALVGRGIRSTKENPLRGATEIEVETKSGSVSLNAKLGGVRSMALFVCSFPVLLWAILAISASLKSGDAAAVMNGKALIGAAVWLVIGPVLAVWIRRRTIDSLEDMLENALALAKRS